MVMRNWWWVVAITGLVACGSEKTKSVTPTAVTLHAPDRAVQGEQIEVIWKGPGGDGDFITAVPSETEDGRYGNYALTQSGSPLRLTLPMSTGPHEIRYMTGVDKRVLARRSLQVEGAEARLMAPPEAVAGSLLEVEWRGPAGRGDYITIVAEGTPDEKYGNYVPIGSEAKVKLLTPLESGGMELRYVTGQGGLVLARSPVVLSMPVATLEAVAEAPAATPVRIHWTGPNYSGDYITIVPKTMQDGKFLHYALTRSGSPVEVNVPYQKGPAEIRYMSGQGTKVLARQEILVK